MKLLWGTGRTLQRFWQLFTGQEATRIQADVQVKGSEGEGLFTAEHPGIVEVEDSYRRRINEIVDVVGIDHLGAFVTFEEQTEPYRDLYNKDIEFRGLTTTVPRLEGGPLGHYVSGVPLGGLAVGSSKGFRGGGSSPTYAPKYAVKMKHNTESGYVGSVRLRLRAQGDISRATFKVTVYDDRDGKPGDVLMQVDEMWIDQRKDPVFSGLDTIYRDVFIPLITGVGLTTSAQFWLVLEYQDGTGIDQNNYIQWQYGSDPGGTRAYHDGNDWVVVEGESFEYELIDEGIQVPDDLTVIMPIRMPRPLTLGQHGLIDLVRPGLSSLNVHLRNGTVSAEVRDDENRIILQKHAVPLSSLHSWTTIAVAFSRYDYKNKLALYQNGSLLTGATWQDSLESLRGTDVRPKEVGYGAVPLPRHGGVFLGGMVTLSTMRPWSGFPGDLGPVLIAKRRLTCDEIAKVSRLMLGGVTNG